MCMIRCIYLIQFIAPLIIYLGRSSPCRERCFSITCIFFLPFLPFLPSQFQRRILGCVRSNNFESSPDRSPFVIRCDYSVQEYKESGRIYLCRIYFAKRSWPLQHERRKKQMRKNCNQQLNLEWGVKAMKSGQKNFPQDYLNGTNFKIFQVPD